MRLRQAVSFRIYSSNAGYERFLWSSSDGQTKNGLYLGGPEETSGMHPGSTQYHPYVKTGTLRKGGIIYHCARGSESLESFHLHMNRFIPGMHHLLSYKL